MALLKYNHQVGSANEAIRHDYLRCSSGKPGITFTVHCVFLGCYVVVVAYDIHSHWWFYPSPIKLTVLFVNVLKLLNLAAGPVPSKGSWFQRINWVDMAPYKHSQQVGSANEATQREHGSSEPCIPQHRIVSGPLAQRNCGSLVVFMTRHINFPRSNRKRSFQWRKLLC